MISPEAALNQVWEIAEATPEVIYPFAQRAGAFLISLPHGPVAFGEFDSASHGETVVLESLDVPRHLRGNKIGVLLTDTFFKYAADNGAKEVETYVINPSAMTIFHDRDARIYDVDMKTGEEIELPIKHEQAVMSLSRAYNREYRAPSRPGFGSGRLGFTTRIDIANMPCEYAESPSPGTTMPEVPVGSVLERYMRLVPDLRVKPDLVSTPSEAGSWRSAA